jgi:predicted RNA methylase
MEKQNKGVLIMEKELYEKLRKKWDGINELKLPGGRKHNTYYLVRPGERKNKEKPEIIKHLDLFKGRSVVDIGCNAGYITYHTAQFAKEWVAVERDVHWHAQALETAKYIDTPGEFLNCSIEEFCEKYESNYNYDSLFGSCILYYLSPKELELLQTNVLSKCDMVMLVSREDKPPKTLWNKRDLGKAKNIQKFLEECGFNIELYNKKSNWISVVGRR